MNYGYNFNPLFTRSIGAPIGYSMSAPAGLSSLFTPSSAAIAGTTSKLSFSGILNGASKTLGVINQAIPVFYQVKPIWNNAKTMFRVVKGINEESSAKNTNNNISKSNSKNTNDSSLTFFA